MPAASAGNVLFSKLVAFKEATPGTIPTLTSGGRKLLVTPTGVISDGVTIELGAERSVALRNPLIGSTGTITMPASPADGMVITIESTQQITALTVQGNTGQSLVGGTITYCCIASSYCITI